jgi:hypothetical protein
VLLQPLRILSQEELALQGIWFIQVAGEPAAPGAVVMMMNGTIQGGDGAYLYRGRYEISNRMVKAKLTVSNLSSRFFRCMCLLDAFEWEFEGTVQCGDLIVGRLIQVKAPNVIFLIEFRKQAALPSVAVATSAN